MSEAIGPPEGSRWLEDVTVGDRLPPEVRETSRLELLAYASVSRDLNLIHHDPEFARASGLPDTIVQGTLKAAFLARLASRFAGEWGTLRRFTVQYRGVDVPGSPLTAHGVVERIDIEAGEVELQLWLESASGERRTRGTAVVLLPRRATPDRKGPRLTHPAED
jgi:acyl dehydratase